MNPNEETLTELHDIEDMPNKIEKPKRVASQKQLDALSQAREKRKTKKTALDNVATIANAKPVEPEPTIIIKKKTVKKAVKPTIIQIESGSDSDSSSDDEPPTVIIRRKNNKAPAQAPAPAPVPAEPTKPVIKLPIQYIRRA